MIMSSAFVRCAGVMFQFSAFANFSVLFALKSQSPWVVTMLSMRGIFPSST